MANKLQLNLSGGMNSTVSSLIMKDTEGELMENFILDKVGALQSRFGTTRFASQPVANVNINGLYTFTDSSAGVNRNLMVANNSGGTQGVIYYQANSNPYGWTASSKTNDTASLKSRFSTFVDYVFRVNGTDVVASSADGITWGTTNAPATITPRYTAVFQDRVYMSHGGASNRSRVWFSSLPVAGVITWNLTDDWFDVNPDDGDEITGLENNGNRLLIFKNRAMYRWTFGQVEADRIIGVGTSSQECVKTNLDLGVTFFANSKGVYAYTGGRPKLISRKIQRYIDAVPTAASWASVYGECDADHYYLFVGDITVSGTFGFTNFYGRPFLNAMFVYHISLDAWTVMTFGHSITWLARLTSTLSDQIFNDQIGAGSGNGRTYKMFTGFGDDYIASTEVATYSIPTDFISKEYVLQFPQRTNVSAVDIFAQQRLASNVFYDLDRRGVFTPLGSLVDRVTNFRVPSRECNTFRVEISDNSKDRSIIEGFNVTHEPKEKRDENAVQARRREV